MTSGAGPARAPRVAGPKANVAIVANVANVAKGANVAWTCGGAALLAGLVYLNALPNPFVYDDYHTVVANPSLARPSDVLGLVLYDVTRPLANASFALDQVLSGGAAWGFRATNVVLHVVNVTLLYLLSWHLANGRTPDAGRIHTIAPNRGETVASDAQRTVAPAPHIAAVAAASIFAVHPLMSEAVGYVSSRSEVLCATFLLCAMLAGDRWLRGGGRRWGVAMFMAWLLAIASKETAAMFPIVFAVYDVLCGPRDGWRGRLLKLHVPLILFTSALAAVRIGLLVSVEYPDGARIQWRYLALALDVMRRYLGLLLMPVGQTIFHAVTPVTLTEGRSIGAIAALAVMGTTAWLARKPAPGAAIGLVWFLLLLVPGAVLTLLDQGEPMAEHRIYAASCGFFLAAGEAIRWFDGRFEAIGRTRVIARVAFLVVLLSLAMLTITRNRVWASPVTLWGEAVDLAPDHYRPHLLLGEAFEDAGRQAEAEDQYRVAIALRPDDVASLVKYGQFLAKRGRVDEARRHFTQALRLAPNDKDAQKSLTVLDRMGTDVGR
jgi:protein O-mannosyl-transferase